MFDFINSFKYGKCGNHVVSKVDEFIFECPHYFFDKLLREKGKNSVGLDLEWTSPQTFDDKCFKNVSFKLKGGQKYLIEIFRIGKWQRHSTQFPTNMSMALDMSVSVKDMFDFLEKRDSLLVGVQGLVLVEPLIKKEILATKPLLSLDLDENCKIENEPVRPLLGYHDGMYFAFPRGDYFDPGINLLCVTNND